MNYLYRIIIFFLLFTSINSPAQNSVLDSLQSLLQKPYLDTDRVKIIIAISDEYQKNNPDKAVEMAENALAIAVKGTPAKLLSMAYDNLASKQFLSGNYNIGL